MWHTVKIRRLQGALCAALLLTSCQRGAASEKTLEKEVGFVVLGNASPIEAPWNRPTAPKGTPPVFIHEDQVYIRQPLSWRRLSTSGDRYFDPQLSPDGKAVLFTGLATGIHIVRVVDGQELFRDEGTHPCWSPDSRWIAYEKTIDDGHNIIESDIYIASRDGHLRANLTATPGRIERKPVFSPDGGKIAFEMDGQTWAAPLWWIK